jgi:ubiquinone/menaquinone biosynthesis C-methylase UbiE
LKNNRSNIIIKKVVKDFGNEWKRFDQSIVKKSELKNIFDQYFNIFPLKELNKNLIGFDLGCGSGRWAKFIAPKVKKLNCIDPSAEAISVAKKNLINFKNINYINSEVNKKILIKNSQDFGYCLGVLHHIPDTLNGIKVCSMMLKKNAPFLIYLYYKFDNRNFLFKSLWKISDFLRFLICFLPFNIKKLFTDFLALLIYYPLAKLSYVIDKFGIKTSSIPLSFYKNKSFYTMRTDSLDRFGTKLEKRFTKSEIENLLSMAGFKDIKFSEKTPFWVATCRKK